MIDANRYKEIHKGDIATLLRIYWENKPIWRSLYWWASIALTLLLLLSMYFFDSSLYAFIIFLTDQVLSIMPNILGFNLGGYVLLIGLNSQSILDEITEPDENSDYSLFQRQSSVFAFSILVQATSILLCFIAKAIIEVGDDLYVESNIALMANVFSLLILTIVSIYAVLLIGQIVLNIFNFGQLLHFCIRIDRIDKEIEEKINEEKKQDK